MVDHLRASPGKMAFPDAGFKIGVCRAILARMTETTLEKLARASGKTASKALDALARRGLDIRGKLSAPISRVPRRDPPKPKPDTER
jgi:hypothetical protein